MPITDPIKSAWGKDLKDLMNISQLDACRLWDLLKNLETHNMLEKYLDDNAEVFTIHVAPFGTLDIRQKGDTWEIVDYKVAETFRKTANETLRTKESNLYRELYDRVDIQLKRCLKEYSKSVQS